MKSMSLLAGRTIHINILKFENTIFVLISNKMLVSRLDIHKLLIRNKQTRKTLIRSSLIWVCTVYTRLLLQMKLCLVWFNSWSPINNLSVIKGRLLLGWTSTKLGLMCLAQGHNPVTSVRLEPPSPRSLVKHSTTEPLRFQFRWSSLIWVCTVCLGLFCRQPAFKSLEQ